MENNPFAILGRETEDDDDVPPEPPPLEPVPQPSSPSLRSASPPCSRFVPQQGHHVRSGGKVEPYGNASPPSSRFVPQQEPYGAPQIPNDVVSTFQNFLDLPRWNQCHYTLETGNENPIDLFLSQPVEKRLPKFYGYCYSCGCPMHSQNFCPAKQCKNCCMFGHSSKVCPLRRLAQL